MPTPDAALLPPGTAAVQALDAARALATAGKTREARKRALPLLGEPALHVPALMLLHDLARREGDAAEALRLAARAARLAPESPRALGLCAMAQTDAGRHEAALATARNALARDPEEKLATAAQLLAACRLGRPQAARDTAVAVLAAAQPGTELAPLAAQTLAALAGGGPCGVLLPTDGREIGGRIFLARDAGEGAVQADLTAGGKRLARVAAAIPVGPPEAGLFAFRYAPPEPLAAGTEVAATLTATGAPFFASPQMVTTPRMASPGPVRGAVRALPDGRIVGHLFDPARPLARQRVALVPEDDPAKAVTVTAADFDATLLARGYGDGSCAFSLPWPATPGTSCRRVHVLDAATRLPLAGSPVLAANPREAAMALSRFSAWLHQAGNTPDAPPPLPEDCRGPLLDLARAALAALAGGHAAAAPEPETPGDAHA
ncbi:hypothetical protein [Solidesulfovibrio alcoholivorans]|uniref:hypothetical protein n=1 Tax=Solidesulfovibrio alcoholivorans TaxID=81406 RepID=UPI000694DAB1|nr:hypothetical protein [Solidesulfovibrio alcoholivorans]